MLRFFPHRLAYRIMKYLTLIRHAKSDWDDPTMPDHDRPLAERGFLNAPLVARFLARTYLGQSDSPALLPRPERLISSTALRAKTTAELMLPELGVAPEILKFDTQAYLATPKMLLQLVKALPDDLRHVMIFGHNPGISDFADKLIMRGGVEQMPTCAAALIELPWDVWSATDWDEARLVGYVTPRLIQKRFPEPPEAPPLPQ
jgi:phosphohistidine phosphatase